MDPDLTIEITLDEGSWRAAFPGVEDVIRRAAEAAWHVAGRPGAAELSVVLADDAAVRELNRLHRGKDAATNVLAFPLGETPPLNETMATGAPWLLGDVVLALETVRREAARDGKTLAAHVAHLVIHGLLHLLGHDHETAAEAEAMEGIEVEVLRRLGHPDPYATVFDAAE